MSFGGVPMDVFANLSRDSYDRMLREDKEAIKSGRIPRSGLPSPLWGHAFAYWIHKEPTTLDVDIDGMSCWPTAWTWPG